MKYKAIISQEVEVPEDINLDNIQSVDEYDEIILKNATAVHTALESIEALPQYCKICGGPLRALDIDGHSTIYQCRGECRQTFNQNMEVM